MNPSLFCIAGSISLAIGMTGKHLVAWAPSVGWGLAIFFFSCALHTALKRNS